MFEFLKNTRPVGETIRLRAHHNGDSIWYPWQVLYYQSGTAALAAAVIASIRTHAGVVRRPEVILPAYGCPDLISAIVYAGANPVLVDLEQDSPRMDIHQLNRVITENTVAIIAVRFLGIPEQMDSLRTICEQRAITLIEDSAQGFPLSEPGSFWKGDYNIVSFGRGKPLSLLSGGAVLTRNDSQTSLLPTPSTKLSENHTLQTLKSYLRILLYNLTIRPVFYGLITRLPGLHIGQTIFKPLAGLEKIPEYAKKILTTNYAAYKSRTILSNEIKNILTSVNNPQIIDLTALAKDNKQIRFLRYPILVKNPELKSEICHCLRKNGVSLFYKKPLHLIKGVGNTLQKDNTIFPNAELFAQSLITLPTHSGVTIMDLREIRKCLTTLSEKYY